MFTQNKLFQVTLEKLINEAILQEANWLSDGSASDYADYKYRSGRIAAFRVALDLCKESESIISKV